MAQFGLPTSDRDHLSWSEGAGNADSNHFDELDEGFGAGRGSGSGPDDATTFWESISNPSAAPIRSNIDTSLADPNIHTGHVARGRNRKSAAAGRQIDLLLIWYQDPSLTQIHAELFSDVDATWTTRTFTLSEAEAANLTDYTDLVLTTTATATGGGQGRRGNESAHELELPDVVTSPELPLTTVVDRLTPTVETRSHVVLGQPNDILEGVVSGMWNRPADPVNPHPEQLVERRSAVVSAPPNDLIEGVISSMWTPTLGAPAHRIAQALSAVAFVALVAAAPAVALDFLPAVNDPPAQPPQTQSVVAIGLPNDIREGVTADSWLRPTEHENPHPEQLQERRSSVVLGLPNALRDSTLLPMWEPLIGPPAALGAKRADVSVFGVPNELREGLLYPDWEPSIAPPTAAGVKAPDQSVLVELVVAAPADLVDFLPVVEEHRRPVVERRSFIASATPDDLLEGVTSSMWLRAADPVNPHPETLRERRSAVVAGFPNDIPEGVILPMWEPLLGAPAGTGFKAEDQLAFVRLVAPAPAAVLLEFLPVVVEQRRPTVQPQSFTALGLPNDLYESVVASMWERPADPDTRHPERERSQPSAVFLGQPNDQLEGVVSGMWFRDKDPERPHPETLAERRSSVVLGVPNDIAEQILLPMWEPESAPDAAPKQPVQSSFAFVEPVAAPAVTDFLPLITEPQRPPERRPSSVAFLHRVVVVVAPLDSYFRQYPDNPHPETLVERRSFFAIGTPEDLLEGITPDMWEPTIGAAPHLGKKGEDSLSNFRFVVKVVSDVDSYARQYPVNPHPEQLQERRSFFVLAPDERRIEVIEGPSLRCRVGSPRIASDATGFGLYVDGKLANAQWQSVDGLDIALGVNGQGSMSFTMVTDGAAGEIVPSVGDEGRFYLADEFYFGGYIEEITVQNPITEPLTVWHFVTVTPYSALLKRRIICGYFGGRNNNRSFGFQASSLTIRFLEQDFIDFIGPFPVSGEGPEYFPPMAADEAMNRIASESGTMWQLNEWKELRFLTAAAGVEAAPSTIDVAAVFRNTRSVTTTAGEYRNTTFVTMSSGVAEFTEDAQPLIALALNPGNVVFATKFPVDSLPTITVFGSLGSVTLETVIEGPNVPVVGWDAFHVPGQSSITLNPTAPFNAVVGVIERVEITYQIVDGIAPFVVAKDAAAIEARRVAEGGLTSGQYDAAENQTDIEDPVEALALANELNAYYSDGGALPLKASCESDLPGWRPGQLATVDWPDMGISSQAFLIDSVNFREVDNSIQAAGTPFMRARLSLTRNGSEVARRVQRVRRDRPKTSIPITFVIAKTLDGGVSNAGASVGTTKPPQLVITRGLLISAALVWEFGTQPTGADFSLEIQHAEAETPQTWVTIGTLTTKQGVTNGTVLLSQRVEVNDLLRLNIISVGSDEAGRDGIVHIREVL